MIGESILEENLLLFYFFKLVNCVCFEIVGSRFEFCVFYFCFCLYLFGFFLVKDK